MNGVEQAKGFMVCCLGLLILIVLLEVAFALFVAALIGLGIAALMIRNDRRKK